MPRLLAMMNHIQAGRRRDCWKCLSGGVWLTLAAPGSSSEADTWNTAQGIMKTLQDTVQLHVTASETWPLSNCLDLKLLMMNPGNMSL